MPHHFDAVGEVGVADPLRGLVRVRIGRSNRPATIQPTRPTSSSAASATNANVRDESFTSARSPPMSYPTTYTPSSGWSAMLIGLAA